MKAVEASMEISQDIMEVAESSVKIVKVARIYNRSTRSSTLLGFP